MQAGEGNVGGCKSSACALMVKPSNTKMIASDSILNDRIVLVIPFWFLPRHEMIDRRDVSNDLEIAASSCLLLPGFGDRLHHPPEPAP